MMTEKLWFCRLVLQDVFELAPLTAKTYAGCQVGWKKAVYYVVEKN